MQESLCSPLWQHKSSHILSCHGSVCVMSVFGLIIHVCACTHVYCTYTPLCIVCGGGRGGVKHTVVSRKRLFCSCRCVWVDTVEWGHLGPWILRELRNYLLCFQFKCKCWECELLGECRCGEENRLHMCVQGCLQVWVYYTWLVVVSKNPRAGPGGIITAAREWPEEGQQCTTTAVTKAFDHLPLIKSQ